MKSMLKRRDLVLGAAAFGALGRFATAQAAPHKIGVLTDMNGALSASVGRGSVLATEMAIEDFKKSNPNFPVTLVSADMQNKPDVTVSIAREWLDREGVDVITEVPISAGAMAIAPMVAQRDKLALFTSASTAELTGTACGPNHLQWTLDTWAMARASVDAQLKTGGLTWFFIAADTAFGAALQVAATQFIEAGGGKVLGGVKHPFPGNTDFSSQLVAAQQSGANVIAVANSGPDAANCIKQANEFGIMRKQKVCALFMEAIVVTSVGLQASQGVYLTESFYWDLNPKTRDFSQRFKKRSGGAFPTQQHAGQYSAVWNYLTTVAAMGGGATKPGGKAVIAAMRRRGTFDDPLYGPTRVREDGRVIHRMYVFQVKAPGESKYEGDIFKVVSTIPEEDAFRPLKAGGCPLVT